MNMFSVNSEACTAVVLRKKELLPLVVCLLVSLAGCHDDEAPVSAKSNQHTPQPADSVLSQIAPTASYTIATARPGFKAVTIEVKGHRGVESIVNPEWSIFWRPVGESNQQVEGLLLLKSPRILSAERDANINSDPLKPIPTRMVLEVTESEAALIERHRSSGTFEIINSKPSSSPQPSPSPIPKARLKVNGEWRDR